MAEVQAVFENREQAERALHELRLAGFGPEQAGFGDSKGGVLGGLLGGRSQAEGPVVAVTGARRLEAAGILHRHGGRDLGQDARGDKPAAADGGEFIDVLEERLVAEPAVVNIGQVRVSKRVVTEQRTIQVEVRREEIFVEHLPLAEPLPQPVVHADDGYDETQPVRPRAGWEGNLGLPSADEEVIRIPLLAEQVVVSKQPVVVEEVVVRKRRLPEVRVVQGEVRREEVVIEREGEFDLEEVTRPE
ncbi:MAG: YsnF/AvaK domain-containing protein [Candidatus Dormibacteraeota bacterium]|nr:YsnF/AvaK domain-containing protein [Candidatus Dormibacteraeota bacterium]